MSLINCPEPPGINIGLPRRSFVLSALLGSVAAGLPSSAIGRTVDSTDCHLPSAADSMVLYISLLFDIQKRILDRYFDDSQDRSGAVKTKYNLLLEKVLILEKEVPGLRSDGRVSFFKGIAQRDKGRRDPGRDAGMAWFLANADHQAVLVFAVHNLSESVRGVQSQQGLYLSPKAAETLRQILQLIRELNDPVQSSSRAATALNIAHREVGGKILEMRNQLLRAVSLLVTVESGGVPSDSVREATSLIDSVIRKLVELDSYQPSVPVDQTNAGARLNPQTTVTSNSQPERTKVLRDLLKAVLATIPRDLERSSQAKKSGAFAIAAVSYDPSPASGLFYRVRDVLRETPLPQALWLRAFSCTALVLPILASYGRPRSAELIYDVIPYIIPGGPFDNDDGKRREAADRLAQLSV